MAEVMSVCSVDEIGLSPRKGRPCYQIFPDPSDFERCCQLKDCLPSIVLELSEGEVESGELRWPPAEFMVTEEQDQEVPPGERGLGCPPGERGPGGPPRGARAGRSPPGTRVRKEEELDPTPKQ